MLKRITGIFGGAMCLAISCLCCWLAGWFNRRGISMSERSIRIVRWGEGK